MESILSLQTYASPARLTCGLLLCLQRFMYHTPPVVRKPCFLTERRHRPGRAADMPGKEPKTQG